jgi:hypothetical protein
MERKAGPAIARHLVGGVRTVRRRRLFKPVFDKKTGAIDRSVASTGVRTTTCHILRKNWSLGPKLAGKLHIYMGDVDARFLDRATVSSRRG